MREVPRAKWGARWERCNKSVHIFSFPWDGCTTPQGTTTPGQRVECTGQGSILTPCSKHLCTKMSWQRRSGVVWWCSVAKSGLTLCNPVDCIMPRLPCPSVSPGVAQTHVHWCGDAIQPSHPLSSFSCLQSFPASQSFPVSGFFPLGGQSTGTSAPAPILPRRIQGWFPLRWTGLILLSKGLSGFFSSTTVPKFFGLWHLYSPALTSIRDYWKDHSLDYRDHCR